MGSLIHVLSIWSSIVRYKDKSASFVLNLRVGYKDIDWDVLILFAQQARIQYVLILMDVLTIFVVINTIKNFRSILFASKDIIITVITMIQETLLNKHTYADICAI